MKKKDINFITSQSRVKYFQKALDEPYQDLKAKYEAEEPMRRHKQEAQEWLAGWQGMVKTCPTHQCLEHGYIMVSIQKEQFADLPEIVNQVMEVLNMRALELERERLKVRNKE